MLLALLTTGCVSSAVRTLGRTTTFDGPRGVVFWKSRNIRVKDVRYQVREPSCKETVLEQRFYVVTPADISVLTNTSSKGCLSVSYREHPIEQGSPIAREIESILSASWPNLTDQPPSVDRVWGISKGFGGVFPLRYPAGGKDLQLWVGLQFSQEVGQNRTPSGKVLQALLIPAMAIDIVTFPIQFLYFTDRLDEAWQ